jgi:hypothetical protein
MIGPLAAAMACDRNLHALTQAINPHHQQSATVARTSPLDRDPITALRAHRKMPSGPTEQQTPLVARVQDHPADLAQQQYSIYSQIQ